MNDAVPRILATRISRTLTDTLEILCLERGRTKTYRIYTTTDEELAETRWDLDAVEFDSYSDVDLNTYLIESFWLLRINQSELRSACGLFDQYVVEPGCSLHSQQSILELGTLGVLLIEMLNRLQTIKPEEAHSFEALQYLEANLRKLETLSGLPPTVTASINGCRLVFQAMMAEAALRQQQLRS